VVDQVPVRVTGLRGACGRLRTWFALALLVLGAGCSESETVVAVDVGVGTIVRLATPEPRAGGVVLLRFRLIADTTTTADVLIDVTADGRRTLTPATSASGVPGAGGRTGLTASPIPGTEHLFAWDSLADVPQETPVEVIVTPLLRGRPGASDSALLSTTTPEDLFEPNDDFATSTDLAIVLPSGGRIEGLSIGPDLDDVDVYAFTTGAGPAIVRFAIEFRHDAGDLDLVVYDENELAIAGSFGVIDDEEVRVEAPAGSRLFIEVSGFNLDTNSYALVVEEAQASTITALLTESFDAPGVPGDLSTLPSGAWSAAGVLTTATAVTATSDWELGAPVGGPGFARSGAGVAGTLLASGGYTRGVTSTLTAPAVQVPATSTGTAVSFFAWIDIEEEEFDLLHVEASVGGAPFTTLGSFTGDLTLFGGYGQFVVPGPAAAGQSLVVRLRLVSDADSVRAGVYVDDFRILSLE